MTSDSSGRGESPATDAVGKCSTTVAGTVDLFGHDGQAEMYRDFRPRYPNRLVKDIVDLVPEHNRGTFLDVACGPGILTAIIAPKFRKTIGLDKSFEQLKQAVSAEGCEIEYLAGSAFEIPLADGSVDLVTVAQGLHWLLPYELLFDEALRVLKPGGVFAAAAYAFPRIHNTEANKALRRFYCDLLGAHLEAGSPGCWWETSRPTIDGFYERVPFPRETTRTMYPETIRISVRDFMNYLRTLSAYRTLLRFGQEDPLPALEAEIIECLPQGSADAVMDVDIPFFVVTFAK